MVLEHPRAPEAAGRDGVEACVPDQLLGDLDGALLGRVEVARRHALLVDLVVERPVIAVERFCYRTAHVQLDLVGERLVFLVAPWNAFVASMTTLPSRPLTLPRASPIASEGTASSTASASDASPPVAAELRHLVAGVLPAVREPAADVSSADDRDVHRLLLSGVDSKSTSCDDFPVSVLRERNFRYLFAARTISFFGTNLAPIAVAFAVLGLGGSATEVGLAFAAWTLAQISTLLVGGVVADRLPRRLVMIGSDTASLCVRVTMGALLVSGHAADLGADRAPGGGRRRGRVLLARVDAGSFRRRSRERLLQQANSFMSIARYAAFPLGAAVGGTLVATVGSGYALLLDGATYGVSALLLAMMHLPAQDDRGRAELHPRAARGLAGVHRAHVGLAADRSGSRSTSSITYAPFFVLGPYVAKHDARRRLRLGRDRDRRGDRRARAAGSPGCGCGRGGRCSRSARSSRVTALQCVLLALRAPVARDRGRRRARRLCLLVRHGRLGDVAPVARSRRDKLSRVSAYNWMGAMASCRPATRSRARSPSGSGSRRRSGSARPGSSSRRSPCCCVPSVRNFRSGAGESATLPYSEVISAAP